MWTVAEYRPVAFFSLRPANATVSGGKTLVTPTPFALKMALLDAAIRTQGVGQGQAWWPIIRDLKVAVSLPDHFLVVKTFQRILRPKPATDRLGTGMVGPWITNLVYREYVQYDVTARLSIAVQYADAEGDNLPLDYLFSQINYLGKRGSFLQFAGFHEWDDLPAAFTLLNPQTQDEFPVGGLMQFLDDCGGEMTFAHANVFDETQPRLKANDPRGRQFSLVVLPYQQVNASRSFTAYQRIQERS